MSNKKKNKKKNKRKRVKYLPVNIKRNLYTETFKCDGADKPINIIIPMCLLMFLLIVLISYLIYIKTPFILLIPIIGISVLLFFGIVMPMISYIFTNRFEKTDDYFNY